MPDPFSHQALTDLVLACLTTDPTSIHISPVKTGKHNASYWVKCDQGRFVLRIAPPDDVGFLFYERLMMRQEPALHDLIRAKTDIPVAEIVAHDFSRRQIDRDFMLMTALPGEPISEVPGLTKPQFDRMLEQVGAYLSQLHNLTASNALNETMYGYLGAHSPMTPQPSWAEAFSVMWHTLLDDVVACGTYSDAEAQIMRNLLNIHAEQFERPATASLLHMDVWSQNILIDPDGNVTGLVDFDRALWGDVEIEFAVLDYCGISEPPFWTGYGSARDESMPAMIRRQFYLLYEIQKYMPIEIWRRTNRAKAMEYKQQCFALAETLLPTKK